MPSLRVGSRLRTYKPGLDRVEAWPVELRNSTGWSSRRSSWSSRWLLPSSFAYPVELRPCAKSLHAPCPICSRMLQKTYFKGPNMHIPDIAFATNLLARYSSSPTRRHWNGIKHIFRYLQGTIEFGLYYSRNPEVGLVGFADAGYLSDPHKARSQTGYVFTYGGTAISWRSQKQTLVATSSNYAEIIALHEACRSVYG
ncbi:unnamed protein product [Microthlaspi erraticum]|uniref:Reverse transcriptase Ty1/copia-type domain-containing protein n=1 Tax=Microthlaspi erraticum TaxID=1685480 RepID=A0A6D2I3V6_9BRAS|nr:unnamed protein product [Microthlaspi erraticum]